MRLASIFQQASPSQLWDKEQRIRRKKFLKAWKPWEDIQAGVLAIPENSAVPNGRTIPLTYALIRKKNKGLSNAPILVLTGGPGISALQSMPFWIGSTLRDNHDLILVDQRGTDFSNALPNIAPALFGIMAKDLSPKEECESVHALMKSFIHQPIFDRIDTSKYHPYQSVEDLVCLMQHLGYHSYHLLGLSHGTKLSSILMDRYPCLIKSSILYGPWPTNASFFQNLPAHFTQAWEWFLQQLKMEGIPCPQARLDQVLEQLQKNPITIQVKGQLFVLKAKDVIFLLRYFLYFPDARTKIPSFLDALIKRDRKRLQQLTNRPFHMVCGKVNLTTYASSLAYDECDEDSSYKLDEECSQDHYFQSGLAFFPSFARHLSLWKQSSISQEQRPLQPHQIPSLIMVHEGDPVTPPSQGLDMQQTLLNSEMTLLKECGHVYLDESKFALMNAFFSDQSVSFSHNFG
ncbi:MAG: alpha/beta hydrolase [Bacteroidota bacterium]